MEHGLPHFPPRIGRSILPSMVSESARKHVGVNMRVIVNVVVSLFVFCLFVLFVVFCWCVWFVCVYCSCVVRVLWFVSGCCCWCVFLVVVSLCLFVVFVSVVVRHFACCLCFCCVSCPAGRVCLSLFVVLFAPRLWCEVSGPGACPYAFSKFLFRVWGRNAHGIECSIFQ